MRKIIAVLLLAASALPSGATTFTIDPAHSYVGFKIRHIAGRVPGNFTNFSGTINFDERDLSKSSVDAVIQAASIDTRNSIRDNHLRTKDFFGVDAFPTITFKSDKVVAIDKTHFKVSGQLAMHGVTKPVTLDVEYTGSETDPKGALHAGFSAETALNRHDWGVGGGMLGDMVAISIDIEAGLGEPAKTEAAKPSK